MKWIALLFILQKAFLVVAQNKDWIFDFANKGYDFDQAIPPTGWGGVNRCGEPDLQSPINLMSPIGIYGWIYGEPIPAEMENLDAHYLDPKPSSKVIYERKNFKMFLNEIDPASEEQDSFIISDLAQNLYGCSTNKFRPTSFHFHHPAEHPINGLHHDIAIHIPHYLEFEAAQTKQFAAYALGLQFSVDHFDRSVSQEQIMAINTFMDSLQLDGIQQAEFGLQVRQIPFQAFMDVFDMEHKWIYKGSGAFPPCVKVVAWQILEHVYPIEFKHNYLIRKVFLDHQDELQSTSNIRGIHPVNGHEVYFVGSRWLSASGALVLLLSLLAWSL